VSAVGERTAQAPAVTGVPRCSVTVPVSALLDPAAGAEFIGTVLCGLPAVMRFTGRCPCGHVRDGWLCEPHAAMIAEGGCRACREAAEGAHDCPLLDVSRSTPERSS
jgi:hypothetical protein